MTVLVVGASGATGRLLVEQLLNRGERVKAIVRSPESLPESLKNRDNLSLIYASILELTEAEMSLHVRECQAIASCLGHNLTFKGIFGQPRQLVTEATRRLCTVAKATHADGPVKFVLMNTAGNSNRDLREPISWTQHCVIALLRWLVPPHSDNENAADYLRTQLGQTDSVMEWVAVRPDDLTDAADVTTYALYSSPIRSAIFDAGSTSRINVAHFMAELISSENTWNQWKGQMPVIYNASDPNA